MIKSKNNSIGIVIGTFAAIPYVHLSLECLRRHEPNIEILVHDDCSNKIQEFQTLCSKYNAEFITSSSRKNHIVGDISATYMTLQWNYDKGFDIGVKLSRRFIINKPFIHTLKEIFISTDSITLSGACCDNNFGYRSECMAFDIHSWIRQKDILQEMQSIIENNNPNIGLPEAWYHQKAQIVYKRCASDYRKKYDSIYKPIQNKSGYTDWYIMGLGRHHKVQNILWHNANSVSDYYQLSQEYNLQYELKDFIDPNMGLGYKL